MTTLLPDELLGVQEPRIVWVPPYASSAGAEAIELAAMAGLYLDPWQEFVLAQSLNEGPDGRWAALFVALMVSRQNGKGSILEARELAGLLLFGEQLIIHTAHEYKTAYEAFLRLKILLESGGDGFDRRIKKIREANGEVGVEMMSGARLRFLARSKGSGRGFSCDCLILDEAMFLPESTNATIGNTLSARDNPQVWYTGSAVDQQVHHDGVVFARLREQGIAGGDPSLAYFEWSADLALPDVLKDPRLLDAPEHLLQSNPGYGLRLNSRVVGSEKGKYSTRSRAVERFGIGDWPRTDEREPGVVNLADWAACGDPESTFDGAPVFAVDINPERTAGTIAVAGTRADGLPHVEIVDHGEGVGWLAGACTQLQRAYKRSSFVIQARGPAQAVVTELMAAKITVVEVGSADYAGACGAFYDAVSEHRLRHKPPQPEIESALDGVKTRSAGDAWTWGRKESSVDISPLVAVTLALWGVQNVQPPRTPRVWTYESALEAVKRNAQAS